MENTLELTSSQADAISALKLDTSDVMVIAQAAFDSALRGRVKAALNKKIVAHHAAQSKGAEKQAARLSSEIAELETVLEAIL